MRKKVIRMILICILLSVCCLPIHAKTLSKIEYDFNRITEEDSIEFVAHYNITIPTILQKKHSVGHVTRKIIQLVYNNSNYVFAYNYEAMQEYANSIKKTLSDNYVLNDGIQRSRYLLQYSKVKDENGNWVNTGGAYKGEWDTYNCYAYAINRKESLPFYATTFKYQPGDMADDDYDPSAINVFEDCETIFDLAELVEKDLLAMGYSNITISSSLPTVNSSQELICVRMGEEDYHFMHYSQADGAWYHKPSATAVLKYNSVPQNSLIWNNERSRNGVEYSPYLTYNSPILFIRYNKNLVNISSSTSNLTYYLDIATGKDSILEINNATNNNYYNITINSSSSINVELYDENMALVNLYSGSNISFRIALSSNRYYLKINYSNPNIYGSVTIDISSHIHDYSDHYVWKNTTEHKSYCACGSYITDFHVVSPDAFQNGNLFAFCLLCNGRATFGGIIHDGIGNYPYTLNGSFILPNGIIVLVDEDYEAYMNGTLIFINPNENIDRSNAFIPCIIKRKEIYKIEKN